MQTINKILFLLSTNERISAAWLLVMILIMAFLDMIGVASILPFMAVLTNPEIIETNLIVNYLYRASNLFGVNNTQEFLFSLGILVFFLLIISLSFKALTTYFQVRFVQMREYSLAKRLMEGYLNQPYSWFLNRNSADLGKTILSETGQVVGYGIGPLLELMAKGTIAIALIILLILVDPKLAMIVSLLFGILYFFAFILMRDFLGKIGKERLYNNKIRFISLNEAFGAFKEIKLAGLEKIYVNRFSKSAKKYADNIVSSQIISQLPRYILEIVAFGGIIVLLLYLIIQTGSFNKVLPTISLYAFAGYRLMPALQEIYAACTQLTFVGPSLDNLVKDMKNLKLNNMKLSANKMITYETIKLKNVYYDYPNSSRTTLKNINIDINVKTTVGIVGSSGSGKTTTIDVILGLLEPKSGQLEVDGNIISRENLVAWQNSIGYVPQHIYLADDTIAKNIAFGLESHEINLEAIQKASKIANLHEFVINELTEKYQTIIGERGIKLSGGQRQRIGIARALYHEPQILILDEATSSLDNETEKVVMEAVNNLGKNLTIIIITHRLSTVRNCDVIYKLDKGKIVNKGTYSEIFRNTKIRI
jgi:ABC-type multidrug transport system fused ATPase/permease subunit